MNRGRWPNGRNLIFNKKMREKKKKKKKRKNSITNRYMLYKLAE